MLDFRKSGNVVLNNFHFYTRQNRYAHGKTIAWLLKNKKSGTVTCAYTFFRCRKSWPDVLIKNPLHNFWLSLRHNQPCVSGFKAISVSNRCQRICHTHFFIDNRINFERVISDSPGRGEKKIITIKFGSGSGCGTGFTSGFRFYYDALYPKMLKYLKNCILWAYIAFSNIPDLCDCLSKTWHFMYCFA